MTAVQALTGSGGWPMTVFLTPELEPFFGGTYFPPDDRHGLPRLPARPRRAIARRLARDAPRRRREQRAADDRRTSATSSSVAPARGRPRSSLSSTAAVSAPRARTFDAAHGGFGGAPKFPPPMTLEFLLRAWRRTGDDARCCTW